MKTFQILSCLAFLSLGISQMHAGNPDPGPDVLHLGESIGVGESINSADGVTTLLMQSDGNLVLSSGGASVWDSDTAGSGAVRAVVENDGTFKLETSAGVAVTTFHTGVSGDNGAQLWIENDGRAVLYRPQPENYTVLWESAAETTAPAVENVVFEPHPSSRRIGTVRIEFSEFITGLDSLDLVLLRDGQPVDVATAGVSSSFPNAWRMSLLNVTNELGDYVLTLNATGSGITDPAGNALATGFTQSFTVSPFRKDLVNSAELTAVMDGSLTWVDIDSDHFGGLELSLSGIASDSAPVSVNELYRNQFGVLSKDAVLSATIPDIAGLEVNRAFDWGDYDNDGDIDALVVQGAGGTGTIDVYDNDGANGFVRNPTVSDALPGLASANVAWGDHDNDGDLDIFLSGFVGGEPTSEVYDNRGNGNFGRHGLVSQTLRTFFSSSVDWIDYDGDDDLDLFVTGTTRDNNERSQMYDNRADGSFVLNTTVSDAISDVGRASTSWGDYDNDGDQDLLLVGGRSQIFTEVYENDGAGALVRNVTISGILGEVKSGTADWIDYDNDGDLDIFITGMDLNSVAVANMYDNAGGGNFSLNANASAGITPVGFSAAAWGDADGDGDLDLAVSGFDQNGALSSEFHKNFALISNAAPAAPSGLGALAITHAGAQLTWTAPADDITPSIALGYRLRIGTAPGASDVSRPPSHLTSGKSKLSKRPMVNRAGWRLGGLAPSTTYYWSVQALDHGRAGSPFSAEGSFTTAVDPYITWINGFYPGVTDPGIVGKTADPNGDGMSNVFAFVHGTSPSAYDPAASPTITRETIVYRRADQGLSSDLYVERSADLINWSRIAESFIEITEDAFGPGIDRVSVVTDEEGQRVFLRLSVDLP